MGEERESRGWGGPDSCVLGRLRPRKFSYPRKGRMGYVCPFRKDLTQSTGHLSEPLLTKEFIPTLGSNPFPAVEWC